MFEELCLLFLVFLPLGAKYFEWERKGVPLRIEIGPRDVKVCLHFSCNKTLFNKFTKTGNRFSIIGDQYLNIDDQV